MSELTFSEYQRKASETMVYPSRYKIIYPALGLGSEAGECIGKIKKVLRDNDGEFTEEQKQQIGDEAIDALWYISAILHDLGLSLEEYAQRNLDKLESRRIRGVLKGSGDNR